MWQKKGRISFEDLRSSYPGLQVVKLSQTKNRPSWPDIIVDAGFKTV